MDGMCKECKNYGLCNKSGYKTCNNWTPDWSRAVPLEPVIAYGNMVFLDVEELHQWKINNLWNGIDIAVTEDDIVR